jgi:CheY-like chemotaxis protein
LEEGAESSKTVRVRFEVTDTGVGIEPDHVDTIFLPFERVGGAQSEIEGTGLGLAISRNIVSLLGGELHVQSTLGEGSSFWFDLDLLPTDEAPARTGRVNVVPSYRGEPKTILLVDDIAQNREILESFLKPVGFRVEQAESGEQALKAVEDLAPDLIFLDLMMPRMSGYETLAKLSELPRFGRTPVIATSASVFEEERAKSQGAGFADFLPKPVRSEALFSIVAKQLGLDWEESADASPKPSQSALELPSAEELGSLLEFARKGDLERVAREAQLLAAADARYNPFAALVARLARDFETGRTIALLTPKPAKESS